MIHHNHILTKIPISEEFYAADVAAIAATTIARHGETEWRYATLASELHGHVGIYALMGVKMGLYARELMSAEAGSLRVVSYAASTPPVSCFNDGLQVATEATLGHGLIEVLHPFTPVAEAEFHTRSQRLRMRLKNDCNEIIHRTITSATKAHGKDKEYWDEIRQMTLRYWSEWSRKEIFDVICH